MRRAISLGAMALAGHISLATAGPIVTGSYSYSGGQTAAAPAITCGSYSTFNDDGTVSENGGFADLSLYITACNNPAPDLTAAFTITDGEGDSISGTIDAVDTGLNGNTEYVEGTFTVTDVEGSFSSELEDGYMDSFSSSTTITDYQTDAGTGTFIVGTPEPATMALFGIGAIALGLIGRPRGNRERGTDRLAAGLSK